MAEWKGLDSMMEKTVRFGIYLSNFGEAIDARSLADLASEAEEAGWDGFYLWDHILYNKRQTLNMVDPWVALAAMAMQTSRIRLGTTVTPLARRRPWKLARETTTLDNLSGGRLILSVGLGEPGEVEFEMFGEESDPKVRAARLDEGLEILTGLWSGEPFRFKGEHYKLRKMTFLPTPTQSPRIPIWVGGFWPNKAPFRRSARWDGIIPIKRGGGLIPEDIQQMLSFVQSHRQVTTPFDVAVLSFNATKKDSRSLSQLAEAGMTWWLESLYSQRNSLEGLRRRIRQGPPK